MGCFFKFNGFKHLVLSSVLCSFPLAVLTPPSVYGKINLDLGNVSFGIKMQKLIDKAWKCYNKSDSGGLLDVILDIKTEVEVYTGKKIDLGKEIDKIESNVKMKGGKPPKEIFKKFKNLIHSKGKKKHHRSIWMESYFIEEPAMGFQEYLSLHYAATNKKSDQSKEQKELPLKFVLAVSLMLGGAFVMFATPVCPVLGYAGEIMMSTGFGMLLDQGIDIYQEN